MAWYIPLLVFLARICDVSIGTVRIIVVIRGNKGLAMALGFVEVTIWLFAVSAVIANIRESLWTVLAYSGGFAVGNYVGMLLEERIALGTQIIRIVNTDPARSMSTMLREKKYIVTQLAAHSIDGPAELCFVVVPRSETKATMQAIMEFAPRAYITVEDVREVAGMPLFDGRASTLPIYKRLIKFR